MSTCFPVVETMVNIHKQNIALVMCELFEKKTLTSADAVVFCLRSWISDVVAPKVLMSDNVPQKFVVFFVKTDVTKM